MLCNNRIKHVYQHYRVVHHTTKTKALARNSIRDEETLDQRSKKLIEEFIVFQNSTDGGRKTGSSDDYAKAMTKVLINACAGDVMNLRNYKKWSQSGGYIDSLEKDKKPSALCHYLSAVGRFMGYLSTTDCGLFESKAGYTEAEEFCKRWKFAFRDDVKKQQMTRVTNVQRKIPTVAENMQQYTQSQTHKYVLIISHPSVRNPFIYI